jgi:hypothetical protein
MKQNQIKKLGLNKQTISNLEQLKGGIDTAGGITYQPLCATGCVCATGASCGIACVNTWADDCTRFPAPQIDAQ